MHPQFFGSSETNRLYGVYHSPRKAIAPPRAVVICSPIGQEYIRSHWALKLLAKQLARGGVHVLRFDLSGHGDSAGNIGDQNSLQSWIDDIGESIDWIRQKSGAENVMLVGLRFGATLAALAAQQWGDVHSIVTWEPVVDGASYLEKLRTMHSRMVDLWTTKISTRNDSDAEEILGFEYSRSLLNEIQEVKLNWSDLYLPQLIVDLESNPKSFSHTEPSLQRTIRTDDEAAWDQLLTLETAWLRPQTTRLIVKTVDDMFQRLERMSGFSKSKNHEMTRSV